MAGDELDPDSDELDALDAPDAVDDSPPADPEPAGDPEPARARVLSFTGGSSRRKPRPRKPKPEKQAGDRPKLPPPGKARNALQADIAQGVATLGLAAGLGLPTTGHVVAKRSEDIAASMIKLAETNEAVAAALVATSSGMTWVDLGTHAGAILVAVMVDRGLMDPYAFPAGYLGVSASFDATHDVVAGDVLPGPESWGAAPPPAPAYVG